MADEKGASSNGEEVAAILRAQLKEMQANLKEQVFRSVDILQKQIIENLRGGILARRTGALMNSIKKSVTKDGDAWVGTIKSEGVPYALIHEFGGVIRPKNARALTIPTDVNRRRDGSPIMSVEDLRKTGKSFIMQGIIYMKEQRLGGKGIKPMFILKQSVTIPKRAYIAPAIAAKQDQIMKDFGVFINLAFKPKE
jgi:phage gpG-like protein